jgi:hypothetical protein
MTSNFEVGGANLFVDTTTSNVGIRTNAPAYALDVHGTANVGTLHVTNIIGSSLSSGDETDSTSTETGSIVVSGGIGVASNIHTTNLYASSVYVSGGLVTNTGQVTKKTYSFSNIIAAGGQPEINVYFSSNVFYSKITAQLNDLDDEVSTLVVECGGGSRLGTPKNVAIGTKNIFGSVSTNPWSSTVGVGTDYVSFKPYTTIDNTEAGDYHVFVEYTSPDAILGKVLKITKDGVDEITFDY